MQQELSPSLTQSRPGRHCEKSTHRSNMFPFPAGEHTGSELLCGMHCFPGPHTAPGLCGSHVKFSPLLVVAGPVEVVVVVVVEGLVVDAGLQMQGSYLVPSRAQYCEPTQAPGPLHSWVEPGTQADVALDVLSSAVGPGPVDVSCCPVAPPSPVDPWRPFAHALCRKHTQKIAAILVFINHTLMLMCHHLSL